MSSSSSAHESEEERDDENSSQEQESTVQTQWHRVILLDELRRINTSHLADESLSLSHLEHLRSTLLTTPTHNLFPIPLIEKRKVVTQVVASLYVHPSKMFAANESEVEAYVQDQQRAMSNVVEEVTSWLALGPIEILQECVSKFENFIQIVTDCAKQFQMSTVGYKTPDLPNDVTELLTSFYRVCNEAYHENFIVRRFKHDQVAIYCDVMTLIVRDVGAHLWLGSTDPSFTLPYRSWCAHGFDQLCSHYFKWGEEVVSNETKIQRFLCGAVLVELLSLCKGIHVELLDELETTKRCTERWVHLLTSLKPCQGINPCLLQNECTSLRDDVERFKKQSKKLALRVQMLSLECDDSQENLAEEQSKWDHAKARLQKAMNEYTQNLVKLVQLTTRFYPRLALVNIPDVLQDVCSASSSNIVFHTEEEYTFAADNCPPTIPTESCLQATRDSNVCVIKLYDNTAQFLHELRILQILRSRPHVVQVNAIVLMSSGAVGMEIQHYPWDLATWITERKPDKTKIIRVIESVLSGLEHCHECKIVLGHMKPEDIKISSDETSATLFDFRKSTCNMSFTAKHNVSFIPPEVLFGSPTPKSDVYSLGALIHSLATFVQGDAAFSQALKSFSESLLSQQHSDGGPTMSEVRRHFANLMRTVNDMTLQEIAKDNSALPAYWCRNDGRHVTDILTGAIQNILDKACHAIKTVRTVHRLENATQWKMYCRTRQSIEDIVSSKLKGCPPPLPKKFSPLTVLTELIPLTGPNEVWLMHGTSLSTVDLIAQQGFDARVGRDDGRYGSGVYFGDQMCKCLQYTSEAILLCRVALGRFQDSGTTHMPRIRRPGVDPTADRPYDSVIGMGDGEHNEYIVYDGTQAYPEFLLTLL
eukprot:PhF_6_TR35017/c0_g1_i1/m.50966